MLHELTSFFLVFLVGSVGQLMDGTLGMGFWRFLRVHAAHPWIFAGHGRGYGEYRKVLTGIFSGRAHWRTGNVRTSWLLRLIVPGFIGGALGAHFLVSMPQDKFRL